MVVAVLGVAILAALAAFQAALVAGAPLGRLAWGGQHVVLPRNLRIGSAISIALYAFFAVLMLQAAGAVAVLPGGFAGIAIRVLAGYFAFG